MKRILMTATLSACAAAVMVACGGGEANDAPMLTANQATTLAANTINAVLWADQAAKLVVTNSLGSGSSDAGCMQGQGSVVTQDTDGSGTMTAGDQLAYSFNACQFAEAAGLLYSGEPVLRIAGGQNVEPMWLDREDGQIMLEVATNGMRMGAGTSLAGSWFYEATRVASAATEKLHFPSATLGAHDVVIRFEDVRFEVGAEGLINLTGQVKAPLIGYGDITTQLTLKAPLVLDASQYTRYVPTAGTVLLTGSNFVLEVEYGAKGLVTLRLDHGQDGTVDLEVVTSVQALDALLLAPAIVVDEPGTAGCLSPDAGTESAGGGGACSPRTGAVVPPMKFKGVHAQRLSMFR
jgi:hypothetical protein